MQHASPRAIGRNPHINAADSSAFLIQANETSIHRSSFDCMIDDIGLAVAGLAVVSLLYWLFVVEPRTSVHPDH